MTDDNRKLPPWYEQARQIHVTRVASRDWEAWTFSDLVYLAMGFAGEAGEVANEVKKLMRGDYHGSPLSESERLAKLREEICDARVYLELLTECAARLAPDGVPSDEIARVKLEIFRKRAGVINGGT